MKERPVLFSAQMVRAILDDRKTQTRRVIRWPFDGQPRKEEIDNLGDSESLWVRGQKVTCPYGMTGDRLWVRERHSILDVTKSALSQFPLGPQNNNERGPDIWNICVEYSDGTERETSVEGTKPKQTRERGETGWRPSIFMPRWASRITLEVTGVRVERLQDISREDAAAEGHIRKRLSSSVAGAEEVHLYAALDWYRDLWDSINGKRGFGWDKNPWVWIVEFKRA